MDVNPPLFETGDVIVLHICIQWSDQKRLAESEPWHLSGLSVFTSADGSRNNSISFDLVDNNVDLQAGTTCSRSVLGPVEDADNFYPCDNSSFNFRWDGTTLRIQRFYTDTAVGPCPLYCSVTVYGNGTPSLALDYHSGAGTGTYQDSLDIFVTEMVA
ncbi:hypothetical protein M436DRAFT_75126 [Aureobasidium namibiae CBS 147.97]|uniref:AA1-like domain-containing protein n=1 Tax=Aureobasidium namibiae CBS 147.97 TaxID=1043004 RepID=A0A074WGP6_9PEZI